MFKDKELITPDNLKWIKGFGLYQTIGGSIGLTLLFILPFLSGHSLSFFTLVVSAVFFGFSIFAGEATFRLRKNFMILSEINQFFQLFSFAAGSLFFEYISGFGLSITLDLTQSMIFGFEFGPSTLSIGLNSEGETYFFGINLIAIYTILKLEKIKTQVKTKKQQQPLPY